MRVVATLGLFVRKTFSWKGLRDDELRGVRFAAFDDRKGVSDAFSLFANPFEEGRGGMTGS